MSVAIDPKFDEIIANSVFVWFTTVRADGMPQPTPVWFVRDGDSFIIYTIAGSHKTRNFSDNPKVSLSWANQDAGNFCVVMGEVKVDDSIPPANVQPAYIAKYRDAIAEIGFTPETFIETWSVPLRITPVHVRGTVE
jgi:PPOX class probable F420-dependent enzyme